MRYAEALRRIEDALEAPLPGDAAQSAMAPTPRRDWPSGLDRARARAAAGLLLLFPIDDRAHVLLTVRADTLGRHSGQVSMPGGVIEAGESFERAALREAHEEVGLDGRTVRILGALTPLDIPVTGFRLHPIVATTHVRPVLTAAVCEVARILEVPVEHLLDRSRVVTSERVRGDQTVVAPAFHVAEAEIWGATAMILAEFLSLLSKERQI